MITVVLCGKDHDESINISVENAVSRYGKIVEKNRDKYREQQRYEHQFSLYECKMVPNLSNRQGIFVFKNSFVCLENKEIPNGFIPIFDSQNKEAAAVLKGTGTAAITCGMSPRDTLSIASLDFLSAIISLQRDIKTVHGTIIEPHEFLVTLKKEIGVYPLLATCAVLLLSEIPSINGYCF